jgi:osmoprotectant transport system ATP-binding protein
MRTNEVDSLLVVGDDGNLEGIITARTARQTIDKTCDVSTVMKRNSPAVSPDHNIVEILKILNDTGLSSIPVVDENRILKGLITKSSLLTTLSQQYLDVEDE